MKATVFKEFKFSAAHHLDIPGHPCSNMHGHNYRVRVFCEGDVDSAGMVVDFHYIKRSVQPLIDKLDHSLLNDTMEVTTSEGIAAWILEKAHAELRSVTQVEVLETDSCGAVVKLS